MNGTYLRRKNKLILNKSNQVTDKKVFAAGLKNLERMGYTFSKEVVEILLTIGDSEFVKLYNSLTSILRTMSGANHKFEPMYPNFPKQVMEMSDAELYINAMLHYFGDWIGVRIMPDYEVLKRPSFIEKTKLTIISLGSEDDFINMMKNVISSKTSISESDKEDVSRFLSRYSSNISNVLPEEIPNKEIMSFVVSKLLSLGVNVDCLKKYFKTATDVLRLACAMSDSETSLAKPTKFRNFKRSERRMIVSFIEASGKYEQITEDMLRFKGFWKKLGEKIHVGEYTWAVKTQKAFKVLRENLDFETTNSKIEKALVNKDDILASEILSWRPGDFARRLDHVLRIGKNQKAVCDKFAEVVDKVSTPVLLQVINHFDHRSEKSRMFFPKGSVAKLQIIENKLPVIEDSCCLEVFRICENALKTRFSKLGSLGKVYLDPKLKNYFVPFSQRSASKALKTLVRGSRIPIDMSQKNTLRLFLWWKENTERVDIDLSCVYFDENWNSLGETTYYSLKNDWSCHSGDITSAPKGACEFIDVNVVKALSGKVRYVAASIFSFTSQKYCDLPECFAGFMTRQYENRGKIFDARTVGNKIDLASDSNAVIPMIFDLTTQEMIWTDLSLTANSRQLNVRNNSKGINLMCKAMTELKKPNLYDLFKLHALSRGVIETDIEKADTVFSIEKGITPFDTEVIMSEYL